MSSHFAVLTGVITTGLLLLTTALITSILGAYYLPKAATDAVTAYGYAVFTTVVLSWVVLLGGGAVILYRERRPSEPDLRLKLGVMVATLLLTTVAFIVSCILLSVLQRNLVPLLTLSRNYVVSTLVLVLVAWVLLLAGLAYTVHPLVWDSAPAAAPAAAPVMPRRSPLPMPPPMPPAMPLPPAPAVRTPAPALPPPVAPAARLPLLPQAPAARLPEPVALPPRVPAVQGRTYRMCQAY